MRKTETMPGYPGIYKILSFDKASGRWSEPPRGNKYGVKYGVRNADGYGERRQSFKTFQEAKRFWSQVRSGNINQLAETKATTDAMTFGELLEQYKQLEADRENKAHI